MEHLKEIDGFICVIGNDGAGKSSNCHFINQHLAIALEDKSQQSQRWMCVERSMLRSQNIQQTSYYHLIEKMRASIDSLIKVLKKIDLLTYSYAFEEDWYTLDLPSEIIHDGLTLPVFWVFVEAPVPILMERINKRLEITVYEHPKCIDYFNIVYRQMCFFYGIPSVANYGRDVSQTCAEIYQLVNEKVSPKSMPNLKNMTPDTILSHDLIGVIEERIKQGWNKEQIEGIYFQKVLPDIKNNYINRLYGQYLEKIDHQLMIKMLAKWIQKNFERTFTKEMLVLKGLEKQILIDFTKLGYCFEQILQGESKLLYKLISPQKRIQKYYQDKVFILLKGTIYSHTNQRTGQICELPRIRAKGSMIFMEMLKRNKIQHSYIAINHEGVILSEFVNVDNLEIVFKKQFLGTDKHSYLGLSHIPQICFNSQEVTEYKGGIYVRFDWRNPNHILLGHENQWINLDPYYYTIEKYLGKETFFKIFLSDPSKCKPVGDKCISEDLVKEYTNTEKVKQLVIETYCAFQFYAKEVGLEILDGCFMINRENQKIWSQINPDCLRVKSLGARQDYDKDIWRVGGSSAKSQIIKKWQLFNNIFVEYFQKHRFMDSQIPEQRYMKQIYAEQLMKESSLRPSYLKYYRNLTRGKKRREIIGTIDLIRGSPILVEQSIFKEEHSNGEIQNAWNYIKIMPQIVVVDIDGALGEEQNNSKVITELSRIKPNNIYAVGGGIRNVETAENYFQSVGQIIISSNLSLIDNFSLKQRKNIIVELSINEKNEVLTHGRTVNTQWNLIEKIRELSSKGIQKISITFRNSQGKLSGLPKTQLKQLMFEMPGPIKKVIIAGGISSIGDLQYIWGFDRCVPQLGSAIWKNKIKISEIYDKIVRYDENGLINTIIKSKNDKVLGLVHLNKEALIKTCEERMLYRYSREHQRVMKKGETSGNLQKIQSINIDCDNDCLIVTVISEGEQKFCHLNNASCFHLNNLQNQRKDIISLQEHIEKSKQPGVGSGYSHRIQTRPQLAIHRTLEELEELSLAQNHDLRLEESADSLAHLIMYWNSQNIKINDILSIMNERSRKVISRAVYSQKVMKKDPEKQQIKIGIGLGKHTKFIHEFMQNHLGIQLLQNKEKERCYKIRYKVLDEAKVCKALSIPQFSEKIEIVLVSTKPKDMIKMMHKKFLDFGINYSNMISLYEDEIEPICYENVENLKLGLIKRKNENVCPEAWTKNKKGLIASEYPHELVKYFEKRHISSDKYTLLKVTGHSQGYLSDYRFDYCDAIVHSGRTIEENNLELQAILIEQISVVLFKI